MKWKRGLVLLLTCALILAGCAQERAAPEAVSGTAEAAGLTVNGLTNPLGVESEKPLFGWRTGTKQSAYRITVTDPDGSVVWDSGKVEDSASQNIEYGGEALKPRSRYVWSLTVTDAENRDLPAREAFFNFLFANIV